MTTERQIQECAKKFTYGPMQLNILYIAASPRFIFGGKEGSCARISPNAKNTWNSLWERFLPGFARSPVRRGFCCNEKALAEIQHDTHHNREGFLWIEMLV